MLDTKLIKISNTKFIKNHVSSFTGAMEIVSCSDSIIIENCDFLNNTAGDNAGALSIYSSNDLTILNCAFENNESYNSFIGAL